MITRPLSSSSGGGPTDHGPLLGANVTDGTMGGLEAAQARAVKAVTAMAVAVFAAAAAPREIWQFGGPVGPPSVGAWEASLCGPPAEVLCLASGRRGLGGGAA